MGHNGRPIGQRPWRSSIEVPKETRIENGFSNSADSPDEPKSEPLPETSSLLPAESNELKNSILHRQRSLVILTGSTHTTHNFTTVMACNNSSLMSFGRVGAR